MPINPAFFIAMLITLYCNNVQAEIYTCTDAKGDTVYTDSPGACTDAEEVKVDSLPALTPTKSLAIPGRNSGRNRAVNETDKNSYTELVITSPDNGSIIRDNQGDLTINFHVVPSLQTDHKYVVTMNGTEIYSGTNTTTALKNVDRGTQTIVVKVVDSKDKVMITSAAVKATLQRFAVKQSAPLPGSGGIPTFTPFTPRL